MSQENIRFFRAELPGAVGGCERPDTAPAPHVASFGVRCELTPAKGAVMPNGDADVKDVGDVGGRDFTFGATGVGLMVIVAVLAAIFS